MLEAAAAIMVGMHYEFSKIAILHNYISKLKCAIQVV